MTKEFVGGIKPGAKSPLLTPRDLYSMKQEKQIKQH